MSETARVINEPWPSLPRQREAVTFAVWLFLATEVLFFGGLFLGYTVYRWLYPEGFLIGAQETDIVYGVSNTAIIMTSSLTMAVAVRAAEQDMRRMVFRCLIATALFGLAFLVVKGFEYYDDIIRGFVPGPHFPLHQTGAELFWTFYWVMTAVHAIHLTIGIGMVATLTVLLHRRKLPLVSPAYEGVALYWHLVDIIWVVLLPLLYLIGRAS
ncbi:MAG TPA: cytochrome c oxidase subunit 3 [Pseudolabrys sp.]|nr:cytochrome c oxidase subunit 3 [Pseudolabrys sp.]